MAREHILPLGFIIALFRRTISRYLLRLKTFTLASCVFLHLDKCLRFIAALRQYGYLWSQQQLCQILRTAVRNTEAIVAAHGLNPIVQERKDFELTFCAVREMPTKRSLKSEVQSQPCV